MVERKSKLLEISKGGEEKYLNSNVRRIFRWLFCNKPLTTSSPRRIYILFTALTLGRFGCRAANAIRYRECVVTSMYVCNNSLKSVNGIFKYHGQQIFDCCTPFLYIVPSKVSRLTLTKAATAGRPALTVTWTAPQSDRPITKYQLQYRRSGTTDWITMNVTSTSTILENLSAGTSYQVKVRAVSDVGAGPYSDVVTQITPRGTNVTTAFDVFRSGVDA